MQHVKLLSLHAVGWNIHITYISNLPGRANNVDADVSAALLQTANLCRELGHHVTPIDNPLATLQKTNSGAC